MNDHAPRQTPLAIIGMACRLPGGDGLGELWQMLAGGGYAIGELPADRLDRDLYYDPKRGRRGKTYSSIGGVVADRPFDAQVCPLPDELLRSSDPCHANLCEVAAQACRHAGFDPFDAPLKNTGVYVGHSGGSALAGDLTYSTLAAETAEFLRGAGPMAAMPKTRQDAVVTEIVDRIHESNPLRDAGGGPDLEANAAASLIARAFALTGPHMVVDAACASSLVALKLAAMALDRGTIDMAIVGGASYNKSTSLVLFSQAQSCSATGSKPFDADADGLVSSEGYVALVIKTLDRALADGDTIHAVVRGIGMSSDGRGRSLWAPRKEGQVEAMRRAYGPDADPRHVQYIETHATSTQVGDATELEALGEFFDGVASPSNRLPIGSVKSNVGHTLETAGLAGLLKVVLAMRERLIPPSINVRDLNPSIDWQRAPFEVATGALPWPQPPGNRPRTAAVNAFGIGGLNVHLVVEEYPSALLPSGEGGRRPDMGALPSITRRAQPSPHETAIAVIGRGAILPGARTLAEFAQLLTSGASALSEATSDRWIAAAGHSPGRQGRWSTPTRLGGFVRDWVYDWSKHKIPPKQIATANPLQFMLLDAADQALAEAGYDRKPFDRRRSAIVVGTVFGGDFCNQLQVALHLPEFRRTVSEVLDKHGMNRELVDETLAAFEASFLKQRPALLDESGSFTSSTLASRITKTLDWMGGAMAIDSGTASSLAALSAAADLLVSGSSDLVLCAGAQRSMDLPTYETLSLQGLLKTDRAQADGILPGEGVAMVLLKRLADAHRDGDRILAVVDGIGVSAAPTRANKISLPADSLSEQIGHTQAAHGIASLLKATLELEQGASAVAVTAQATTGLAYHATVGSASSPEKKQNSKLDRAARKSGANVAIARFGAPTWDDLRRQLSQAASHPSQAAFDRRFAPADRVRLAIVVDDPAKLPQRLRIASEQLDRPEARPVLEDQGIYCAELSAARPRVAMLFPGQGSQYHGMLRDLVSASPAAALALKHSDEQMRRLGYPAFGEIAWDEPSQLGSDPWATQLAVLVADTLVAAALAERGVKPDRITGHSFGEFAALVHAGAWTLGVAAQATRARSDAIISHSVPGVMLSTTAPAAMIRQLADEQGVTVHLANFNAPQQTVLAGSETDVARLSAALKGAGFDCVQLAVPAPFHTPMMAGTCAPLREAFAPLEVHPPRVPLLSSVGNRYIADPDEVRAKLVAQMTEPVRFIDQIERLAADGITIFVEAGPQQVLTRLVRQILPGRDVIAISADHPKRSAAEQLLRVQAVLETRGLLDHSDIAKPQAELTSHTLASSRKNSCVEHFDATTRRRTQRRETIVYEPPAPVAMPVIQHHDELQTFLVNFVVDQTGYPPEIVDVHADLEADLGIDSIKKAQLFGELREYFEFASPGELSLADFPTLGHILALLRTARGKGDWLKSSNGHLAGSFMSRSPAEPSSTHPTPAQQPAPAAASGLERFLIDFVVDQTGYPPEIVDLDADLEADLGIDSIKKAQLFGELREHFPLSGAGEIALSDYPTLRHVMNFLAAANVDAPATPERVAVEMNGNGSYTNGKHQTAVVAKAATNGNGNGHYHVPTLDMPVTTDAYTRGLEHGRSQRASLRRALRMMATSGVAAMPEAGELDFDWHEHFSTSELDELRGVAEGAGVHFDNVAAHRYAQRNGGPWTNDSSNNGHTPHDNLPETIASRYVLRMVPAPQRVIDRPKPEFYGDSIVVGDNAVADALIARLEAAGQTVYRVQSTDNIDAAAAEIDRIWDAAPAPHLFITTPHDREAAVGFDADARQRRHTAGVMLPFFVAQRWMKRVLEAGLFDDATLVGCTAMGGDFGLGGNIASIESGALAGMLKSVLIESWVNGHRNTPIKVIDTPATEPAASVVDAVFAELAVSSYDYEIGYAEGRRQIIRAVAERADTHPRRPIRRGGTWVCTGGARGITAYVVRQLALRYDLKLHLIGTMPRPSAADRWTDLSEDGLKRLKSAVMQRARMEGRSPVDAWQDAEKQLEIERTLAEFAADGIQATYYSCDVSDRAALAKVLDEVRTNDGPIEGVLHGAGVGKDARFDRKQRDKVEKCFRAKANGAAALMDLTRGDPLKYFVAFGSISGRFGANGHTDYSAANDMLAKQIDWFRGERPECASVAFHWHAWGDVGMATKPETKLALELIGMQFMPAAEGLQHLIAELEAGAPEGEVLITDDRYYRAFFPAESIVDSDAGTTALPLIASGKTIVEPTVDPFLIEHRLDDRPLLPVVIGMELLCEAALEQSPGSRVAALVNVEALSALRFQVDEPHEIAVTVKRETASEVVRCTLLSDVKARSGRVLEMDRAFLSGTVELTTDAAAPLAASRSDIPAGPWKNVVYAPRGSKFYLGPPLQRLRKIKVQGPRAWGRIAAPALVELAGVRRSVLGWTVPSALLDACLYATGLLAWEHVQPGASLPVSFGRIELGEAASPGETCIVAAEYRGREGRTASFDFTLTGSDGRVLLRVSDYRIAWINT
jgi:acyl transferase domain-containing protein/acyl carrier protein